MDVAPPLDPGEIRPLVRRYLSHYTISVAVLRSSCKRKMKRQRKCGKLESRLSAPRLAGEALFLIKAPCPCSNITIHGHRKTAAVNEGVRLVSFQLLPACLDVL